MNKTTCPMCGTPNNCLNIEPIRLAMNLKYECPNCGLSYTIVCSQNSWNILNKIYKNKIIGALDGRNNL